MHERGIDAWVAPFSGSGTAVAADAAAPVPADAGARMIEQGPHPTRRAKKLAVLWAIAYLASLTFGVLLLVDGDWLPGAIIVAAALAGLAALIRVVCRLRRGAR
jgi:hypothetical protein